MERFDGFEVYEVGLQDIIKNVSGIFDEIEEDLTV